MNQHQQIQTVVAEIYQRESRRIFATLIRMLGDFDLAEEAMHEAFAAAVQQWSRDGVPNRPRAWLVSAGRFRAIDAIRRRERFDASVAELARNLDARDERLENLDEAVFNDSHLRLIFTCCHPVLPPATQIALTLREVCGLTTEEIARSFLASPSTIAQRIVRGKAKIRDARIPYEVPGPADIPQRLDSVLSIIYLVFNEGYSATSGEQLTRQELSAEAIRLGRVLLELLPDTEVMGLLALMLLHESRRPARATADGDLILLEDQDRSLWEPGLIAEGQELVQRALATGECGPYVLQAAIVAVHAEAPSVDATDWNQIVALYGLLARAAPSPIVDLNRAAAIAMRDGPEAGLTLVEELLARGELEQYHLAHAARADLCRRMGRTADARRSYERALALARQEPERRFLQRRLNELER